VFFRSRTARSPGRYANNQWNLAAELVEDLQQTAFHKALALAEGTVSVLDAKGITYSRARREKRT
jgi:hypothetical protein